MSTHETLGLLLVREGLITRPELYDALRLQRQNNRLLGTCLLELGYVRPDALLTMLSRQLGIPALPPGSLVNASPEAVRRVPRELAFRLRVLPYSFDGQILGVALADGRVLEHLRDVAYSAQSAVGAYVALELEIEVALQQLYPAQAAPAPQLLTGRPRPMRTEAPVSAQEIGPAVLKTVKSRPAPDPRHSATMSAVADAMGVEKGGPLIRGAPPAMAPPPQAPVTPRAPVVPPAPTPQARAAPQPAAPLTPQVPITAFPQAPSAIPASPSAPPPPALDRLSFFDAIEQVYAATDAAGVAHLVGRALLNYFSRVLVGLAGPDRLHLLGVAGMMPSTADLPLAALPTVHARLSQRAIAYGLGASEARAAELSAICGAAPGATALFVTVPAGAEHLVVWADNGDGAELYEDLHDVELLFKEAETGLHMLLEKR